MGLKEIFSQIPWNSPFLWGAVFGSLITSLTVLLNGSLDRFARRKLKEQELESSMMESIGNLLGTEIGSEFFDITKPESDMKLSELMEQMIDVMDFGRCKKKKYKKLIRNIRTKADEIKRQRQQQE